MKPQQMRPGELGFCPKCGSMTISREKVDMSGEDTCEKGCEYPSKASQSIAVCVVNLGELWSQCGHKKYLPKTQ